MATLLVLLLLLAVPLTAFSTNVYYVTVDDAAGHEHSCPPHQICHNLFYYISQLGHYFTNNKKIKKIIFYRNQKDVVMKKSTTGPQCKPTRNKHGMVTRLTC